MNTKNYKFSMINIKTEGLFPGINVQFKRYKNALTARLHNKRIIIWPTKDGDPDDAGYQICVQHIIGENDSRVEIDSPVFHRKQIRGKLWETSIAFKTDTFEAIAFMINIYAEERQTFEWKYVGDKTEEE